MLPILSSNLVQFFLQRIAAWVFGANEQLPHYDAQTEKKEPVGKRQVASNNNTRVKIVALSN